MVQYTWGMCKNGRKGSREASFVRVRVENDDIFRLSSGTGPVHCRPSASGNSV